MRTVKRKEKVTGTRRKEAGMKNAAWVMAGVIAVSGVGGAAMAQSSWADKVTVKGDIRYRYETIDDDSKVDADGDKFTRQRDRIRARLGVEAKCSDQLKVGAEISTGQKDPVSGNQTLGDGFAKKDFNLSLAYVDYSFLSSESRHGLSAVGGKMKNPFITMNDDLLWDSDLAHEGLAVKGKLGMGKATLLGNGGYFWIQERSSDDETMLVAGQAALKFEFIPEIALTIGGGYYEFREFQGVDVIDWEGKGNAYGNSTVAGSSATAKAWAAEFLPTVYFAQLDLWVAGRPLSVFAQELDNAGDSAEENAGHMYGLSYGKAKNPKTWEIGYSHAELEKDATVGAFTDSDRWGGGTDGKGDKVYAKYQIMKNLQAGVTYLFGDRKISDPEKTTDYERVQLDLVANF